MIRNDTAECRLTTRTGRVAVHACSRGKREVHPNVFQNVDIALEDTVGVYIGRRNRVPVCRESTAKKCCLFHPEVSQDSIAFRVSPTA